MIRRLKDFTLTNILEKIIIKLEGYSGKEKEVS